MVTFEQYSDNNSKFEANAPQFQVIMIYNQSGDEYSYLNLERKSLGFL